MRIFCSLLLLLLVSSNLVSCSPEPDPRMLRLKLLADTQQRANDRALREAGATVKRIQANVERNRNAPRDLAVLAQARAILQRTQAVSERLRRMRAALLARLGGEYHPRELGSQQVVDDTLLPTNSPVSFDSLYAHLRAYTDYMQQLAPQTEQLPWLLPEDAVHPTIASRTPVSTADYRRFYFEDAGAAEVLAVLAQQEAEVLRLGGTILENQAQRIGCGYQIITDRIGVFASSQSNVVRAGETYRAVLMLVQHTTDARNMRMTANGRSIAVDLDGVGRVAFPAPPALRLGMDTMRTSWDGSVTFRLVDQDTTFHIRIPYTIVR
ncbi:hypothetical protein [Hymenobacter sp. BT190]|uniref:hypothetical protein n=1 Tax=Hymenobacter sp. BT190 TaxID=2763505 RepID=UPI0016516D4D|nr:hypothetical protein [Hymenobacter sp. BT190]MBC6699497.1 hypothetical protein [Hymenobacter sp. BT190]